MVLLLLLLLLFFSDGGVFRAPHTFSEPPCASSAGGCLQESQDSHQVPQQHQICESTTMHAGFQCGRPLLAGVRAGVSSGDVILKNKTK